MKRRENAVLKKLGVGRVWEAWGGRRPGELIQETALARESKSAATGEQPSRSKEEGNI